MQPRITLMHLEAGGAQKGQSVVVQLLTRLRGKPHQRVECTGAEGLANDPCTKTSDHCDHDRIPI